jgi:cytochrome c-type biogenesis protein CcmH
MKQLLSLLALMLALAAPAFAQSGEDALELRAQLLFEGLACPVCDEDTLFVSDSDISRDLRELVRDRLRAGDSDAEVQTYLFDRYGDAVLVRPTLAANIDHLAERAREVSPGETLEARAQRLYGQLRCVVCQNESIGTSDVDSARNMRRLVRERLAAGDSDAEVLDYLQARFGDYVLRRPPVQGNTLFLWGMPLIMLTIGGVAAAYVLRDRRRADNAPEEGLSEDEKKRLAALLDEEDRS